MIVEAEGLRCTIPCALPRVVKFNRILLLRLITPLGDWLDVVEVEPERLVKAQFFQSTTPKAQYFLLMSDCRPNIYVPKCRTLAMDLDAFDAAVAEAI